MINMINYDNIDGKSANLKLNALRTVSTYVPSSRYYSISGIREWDIS